MALKQRFKHGTSLLLHAYADLRIGATELEKRCHKTSDSILLTFDDYGSTTEIEEILAILKTADVKAAFFVQGDWAAENPRLVELLTNEGHIVGNHTYSHPVLLHLSEAEMRQEISKGLPGPWFRPPQGRYNKAVRSAANELGFGVCYWTIDSRDWTGASVNEMKYTILHELHPGATILFHMHGAHTRDLLPSLIDDIRDRGYQLTSHDETWLPVIS